MIPIWASIRKSIVSSLSDWDLGVFARKFIEEKILPKLREHPDLPNFEKLVAGYEQILDKSNPKSNRPGSQLRQVTEWYISKSGLSPDEIEDFQQFVLMRFVKPLVSGGNTLYDALGHFDVGSGGDGYLKFWNSVVKNAVSQQVRERIRLSPETITENRDTNVYNLQERQNQSVDWSHAREIIRDLKSYVISKLNNPVKKDIFSKWLEAVQTGQVDMKNDVYANMVRKGLSTTYQTFFGQWKNDILPLIYDFFVKEQDMELQTVKRFIGSAVDAVTYREYRRQVAVYVLGLS